MPDWVKDLSLGGMAVVGLIIIVITYINKSGTVKKDEPVKTTSCALHITPLLQDMVKSNTELITLMREQQNEFKTTNAKQQEVLQDLVIAVREQIMLTRETLERVKYIEKKKEE